MEEDDERIKIAEEMMKTFNKPLKECTEAVDKAYLRFDEYKLDLPEEPKDARATMFFKPVPPDHETKFTDEEIYRINRRVWELEHGL